VRAGEGVPEQFSNIGIRIEDDVLVTAGGCEILTHATPKSIADIEALMRDA
jgi:Xaa-Pro aminopeptidase